MSTIKVIIKRWTEPFGHVAEIDNSVEKIQMIVGGHFEPVPITSELIFLCNEEGKLLGLPPNFKTPYDTIAGSVIVCGVDGEEFADVPISVDDWTQLLDMWGN